ncbi:MAG: NAD(+)/NADH kinase [Clostridiales Family XIII bacterium]|jgi:NAD+ kinase|nr:NAD(+)/NADH kinase [Clostridiales Family XIII bacterium]
MKKIGIIKNEQENSGRIAALLARKLEAAGYEALADQAQGAELVVCVGGDGSFLQALESFGFPDIPFVGINTGHLGFFQELGEDDIDSFIEQYRGGAYVRQTYRTVSGTIDYRGGRLERRGLNEFVVRGSGSRLAHFDIYIGENFIEKFSGDGVVVSTPAGSTAYNYALGGSIVDPRLSLLQLTPIAAVNNSAYRSFTSGILLPADLTIGIYPEGASAREILAAVDGNEIRLEDVRGIRIGLGEGVVTLLRFKDYHFWNTVKQKLLQP